LTPPLAEQARPKSFDEVVGQRNVLAKLKQLATHPTSFVLWGPPGSGKTTIAGLVAKQFEGHFVSYSAVLCGLADMRKSFAEATQRLPQRTLLFLDEIHRFNKSQQDAFLPHLESGLITLIGATTQNPSFELNPALLSRVNVFILEPLEEQDLMTLLTRFLAKAKRKTKITKKALEMLAASADGDARQLFNNLEAALATEPKEVNESNIESLIQMGLPPHDKEHHYNLASALHKSLRASDTDAALYWAARMLSSGEDPQYLARRLVRFASEDIGLADPTALTVSISAWEAWNRLGAPEGETAIAQAIIHLATAPKSNATYKAWNAAMASAKSSPSLAPPMHILNAPTKLMKEQGFGKGYKYDHDYEGAFAAQDCFPEKLGRKTFYEPTERGFEREIARRLEWWKSKR